MKKILSVLMFLLLLPALFSVPAAADVIYEPSNDFLYDHYSECRGVERWYTAASPDGELTVYESPESAKAAARVPNGSRIYIYSSYTDRSGNDWGLCEGNGPYWSGWVPMSYLEEPYDRTAFEKEFASKIRGESGDVKIPEGTEVWFWDFPGSTDSAWQGYSDPDEPVRYTAVYTDEYGLQWGKIGYYYGNSGCWIVTGDPGMGPGDYLSGDRESKEKEPQPSDPGKKDPVVPDTSRTKRLFAAAAALVLAVIAVTALLLLRIRKRGGK